MQVYREIWSSANWNKKRKEKKEKEKENKKRSFNENEKREEKSKISSEPIDVANVVQMLCNTQRLKISRTTAFKVETSDEEQVKTFSFMSSIVDKAR